MSGENSGPDWNGRFVCLYLAGLATCIILYVTGAVS